MKDNTMTAEQFEHRFNHAKKGSWITYHEGDYSDLIGTQPTGKLARSYADKGRAILAQKRISDEPRQYVYFAVKV